MNTPGNVRRGLNWHWVPWIDGINEPTGGPPDEVQNAALAQLDQSEGRGLARAYTSEEEGAYQEMKASYAQGNASHWTVRADQAGNLGVVMSNEIVATVAGMGDDALTALVYYTTGTKVLYATHIDESIRGVSSEFDEELNNATGSVAEVRTVTGLATTVITPVPGAGAATRGVAKVVQKSFDFANDLRAAAAEARAAAPVLTGGGNWARSGAVRFPLPRPTVAPLTARFPEWKLGDSITKITPEGGYPAWETIRGRYWMGREAAGFSAQNRALMATGRAPKVRAIVRNRTTGQIEEKLVEKELHHARGNRGTPGFDEPMDLREVWPWEHDAIDPSRWTGYEFLWFK